MVDDDLGGGTAPRNGSMNLLEATLRATSWI
jgi:hypothetical protein